MTKILFICHGNICRSVMAEFVFKHLAEQAGLADQFEVASAAVSREEIGNDIYPPAKRKLREKGIPFTYHAARQVTRADYTYYDHLICADRSNLRWLDRIIGEDSERKVSLVMAWTNVQSNKVQCTRDVADPWYTGDFEEAYQDIEEACKGFLFHNIK